MAPAGAADVDNPISVKPNSTSPRSDRRRKKTQQPQPEGNRKKHGNNARNPTEASAGAATSLLQR
ncbi:zinc-activated ligand-gated ion channel [Anopheles sinensis]|uniref:Zinc-activated ligand-gated ion channel n=1 Tax=Anopheles sinensis TaxID=74873 RepID=A0A084VBI6_ANOSI|nr:zinc-activated ligand-gated ion channel [Anopheles sinensis]